MRAPRRRACCSSSSSIAPPPSLSTKPSRSWSHGRLASVGASLRVESAFACPKLPSPQRVVAISPPPAMIRSASPYWMVRIPRPMACVEVVHAAGFLARDVLTDVEIAHLPADAHRKRGHVEARHRTDAALPAQDGIPCRLNGAPDRGHHSKARYDDTALAHTLPGSRPVWNQ